MPTRGNIAYDQVKSTARQGNGAVFQMTVGSYATGHVAVFDSSGNVIDGGAGAGGGYVASVFGRTGAVTAQSGDYTAAQVGALPTSAMAGTTNYVPVFTGANAIGNSVIYQVSGNIGVATTTPATALDVNGMIRSTNYAAVTTGIGLQLCYYPTNSSGYVQPVDSGSGVVKQLFVRGNPLLLNDTGQGSVGIGTASPAALLHVSGSGALVSSLVTGTSSGGSPGPRLVLQDQAAGGNTFYFENGRYLGSFNLWNAVQGSASIVVTNSGNVGIGTTSPGCTLDSSGTIRVTGITSPAPTAGAGVEIQYSVNGYVIAYDRSAGAYKTLIINGNPVIINNNAQGYCGIGFASPTSALHVYSTGGYNTGGAIRLQANQPAYRILDNASGQEWMQIVGVNTASDGYWGVYDLTHGAYRIVISTAGNVGLGTQNPHTRLAVAGLPTYVSNSAATTAGLTAGDFYTDGAGNVKVTY